MGHDLLDVNAVINERIRTADRIELGTKAGLALRKEIENAALSGDRTRKNKSFVWRVFLLRHLNIARGLKKAQNAMQNLT